MFQAVPADCTILHQGMVFDGGAGGCLMIVEYREISMALSFCIYSYMSLDCAALGMRNHIYFCLVEWCMKKTMWIPQWAK